MLSEEGKRIRLWLSENAKKSFTTPSLEEARANLEAIANRKPLPSGTRVEPEHAAGVPCEWISAPGAAADGVILFLHGGGYTIGTIKACRSLASLISAVSGWRVLTVDFRQAPEYPFPAALDDTTAVYRWALKQGIPPDRIVLAGESSGGGLALATLVALRDAKITLPACAVLLSPWTDLACTGQSMHSNAETDPMNDPITAKRFAALYAGKTDLRHPLISPLYADLRGLPPMLIHIGADEIFFDDAVRVADRAKTAGADVKLEKREGMWHAWHHFAPQLPEGQQAIEQIGQFIQQNTKH